LYLLGNLKSFRTIRNEELIRREATETSVCAEVERDGSRHRIEISLNARGKSLTLDGKPLDRVEQLLSIFRAILFAPEEISLLRGSPQARRALLDRALFQTDPGHLRRVQGYERVLRQRNVLLRQQAPQEQIAPWTKALEAAGDQLRSERRRYIATIEPWLQRSYLAICGGCETLTLGYGNVLGNEDLPTFAEELAKSATREQAAGQTLVGPHRDDLFFRIDGHAVRQFGSQGQLRSTLLAFKTAQMAQLHAVSGQMPVLLLDDMTSELDRERQERLYEYLSRNRGQVFITTTAGSGLPPAVLAAASGFRMKEGRLSPQETQ
jgi:DNA replication and repair protein RecF